MPSAHAFKLDQSKILLFGKELNLYNDWFTLYKTMWTVRLNDNPSVCNHLPVLRGECRSRSSCTYVQSDLTPDFPIFQHKFLAMKPLIKCN